MDKALLDEIYHGAAEQPPWQGFLKRLCELGRCQAVSFILSMPRPGEQGVVYSYNADSRYEKRFLTRFSKSTPFDALPHCTPLRLDEIVSREELLASDYYQNLLQPAETEYILGMNLPGTAEDSSLLTLSRKAEQGNFGELERTLLEEIAEHLCRALPVYLNFQDMARQNAVFSDALDHLGIGTIILNRDGALLSRNATAKELLKTLGISGFEPAQMKELLGEASQRFEKMINHCLKAYTNRNLAVSEIMSVPKTPRHPALHILVRPSIQSSAINNISAPAVCIFISLPGKIATPSADMVRELFGFSRAESKVVSLLLSGMTAKEIAYNLEISLSTVRTHIKSILAKAGVNRQSELVASLLRSISLLA